MSCMQQLLHNSTEWLEVDPLPVASKFLLKVITAYHGQLIGVLWLNIYWNKFIGSEYLLHAEVLL